MAGSSRCVTPNDTCSLGTLGCSCNADGSCTDPNDSCDPNSAQCIVLFRGLCDEMNGALGCWCRPLAPECDLGLKCDSTRNCVQDVAYVCTAGTTGCVCDSNNNCNDGSSCASFGAANYCVMRANALASPSASGTPLNSSAVARAAATCLALLAIVLAVV
jgi:hypothetical protein